VGRCRRLTPAGEAQVHWGQRAGQGHLHRHAGHRHHARHARGPGEHAWVGHGHHPCARSRAECEGKVGVGWGGLQAGAAVLRLCHRRDRDAAAAAASVTGRQDSDTTAHPARGRPASRPAGRQSGSGERRAVRPAHLVARGSLAWGRAARPFPGGREGPSGGSREAVHPWRRAACAQCAGAIVREAQRSQRGARRAEQENQGEISGFCPRAAGVVRGVCVGRNTEQAVAIPASSTSSASKYASRDVFDEEAVALKAARPRRQPLSSRHSRPPVAAAACFKMVRAANRCPPGGRCAPSRPPALADSSWLAPSAR
jgi:hypothetical protein